MRAHLTRAPACRLLLIDDAATKTLESWVVTLPRWVDGNRQDGHVEALVDALLSHALPVVSDAKDGDYELGRVASKITAACADVPDKPRGTYHPTDSDAGYYEEYPQRRNAEVCTFYERCGYCKCARRLFLCLLWQQGPDRRAACKIGVHPVIGRKHSKCTIDAERMRKQAVLTNALNPDETLLTVDVPANRWKRRDRHTAGRRFGSSCVKTHPPEFRVKLNLGGFPMRPMASICQRYLRDGFCPMIRACLLHHPNLVFFQDGQEHASEPSAAASPDKPVQPTQPAVSPACGRHGRLGRLDRLVRGSGGGRLGRVLLPILEEDEVGVVQQARSNHRAEAVAKVPLADAGHRPHREAAEVEFHPELRRVRLYAR